MKYPGRDRTADRTVDGIVGREDELLGSNRYRPVRAALGSGGSQSTHRHRQDVCLAKELSHEIGTRAFVDLVRRVDLDNPSPLHHGHAIAQTEGLALIVRHQNGRNLELSLQETKFYLHLLL